MVVFSLAGATEGTSRPGRGCPSVLVSSTTPEQAQTMERAHVDPHIERFGAQRQNGHDYTESVAVTDSTWTPSSWRAYPALQQPDWPEADAVEAVRDRLRQLPSLIFAGEARALRHALGEAAEGRAFLLQAGRLRRVVPRGVGDHDPGAAEGAAADVRRADLRRHAARDQGRPPRRPVHEAALRAGRGGRRGRAAVVLRARGSRRRAVAGGASPRPGTDGAGVPPVRRHAQSAARVHEGRLR